jgi:hypothetical protein
MVMLTTLSLQAIGQQARSVCPAARRQQLVPVARLFAVHQQADQSGAFAIVHAAASEAQVRQSPS